MLYPLSMLSLLLLFLIHLTTASSTHTPHVHTKDQNTLLPSPGPISYQSRKYWMQQANQALTQLSSPCPFAAFGTVIVNHSAITPNSPHGELVCQGVNRNSETGNPTLHGEISALNNLTDILTSRDGRYKHSPAQAKAAFSQLSLYTNAEPCPMCASAIRWAGFKECVFGTSIQTLKEMGWGQIDIEAREVFEKSGDLGIKTKLFEGVAREDTDVYFAWQFDKAAVCPHGCERKDKECKPINFKINGLVSI